MLARLGVGTAISSGVTPAKAGIHRDESKMDSGLRRNDGSDALPPTSRNKYIRIDDMTILKQWIARAYETGVVAFDTETTGLTPAKADLVGVSLSTDVGEGAYIPGGHHHGAHDLLGEKRGD